MDFLDPVLATLRSEAWVYCLLRGAAPWGLRIPASPTAQFHSVRTGSCWIAVDSQRPVELRAGDFAVIPHGTEHRVLNDPYSPAVELLDAVDARPDPSRQILDLGDWDGDAHAELVCGGFQLSRPGPNPLEELPSTVVLRQTGRTRNAVLDNLLDVAVDELTTPQFGTDSMLSSIGRLLLVETLRAASHQLSAEHVGLLMASRDDRVASALAAIHNHPDKPWSVSSLADQANTSRSTLTARFRELMGTSVTRYLTSWRMTVAATLLRDTDYNLNQLANATGYGSEAAFSRAYKRHTGSSPGAHRRAMRRDATHDANGDPATKLPPLFQAAIAERHAHPATTHGALISSPGAPQP